MILYFYGEDTMRSRDYLRSSIAEFKRQRDPRGYNTNVFDAKKIPMDKLFAEISTAPFLAEKRLVVLENLLSSSDKELLGSFIERLEQKKIPESTVLICWQGEALSKVKEAKELQGLLAKEKYAREFPLLTGPKLVEWLEKAVADLGGAIERAAAVELARSGEGDAWHLKSIINQLVSFKNKSQITLADLGEFIEEKVDDNIFNLVDAVVSGNHKTAFKLLTEQRRRGEEDGHLFGLFLWQFRILLEMSDLLEREGNLTSDELASRLKIHPFVAKKNLAIARKYSLSKLESLYQHMLAADLGLKTGLANQGLLLDLLVAKV